MNPELSVRPDPSVFWLDERRAQYRRAADAAGVDLTPCPACKSAGKIARAVPGVPASVCAALHVCDVCTGTGLVPDQARAGTTGCLEHADES